MYHDTFHLSAVDYDSFYSSDFVYCVINYANLTTTLYFYEFVLSNNLKVQVDHIQYSNYASFITLLY